MKKILIVDDSSAVRTDLKRLVEEAGYQAFEASTAFEALEHLRKLKDFALIICDLNMPGMNGIDMFSVAKAESLTSAKMFMITTEANAELKSRAKAVGVSLWITKPYDRAKLLGAIQVTLK